MTSRKQTPHSETDPYHIPAEIDYLHASSSQEFTGLIPSGQGKPEELDIYSEIFPFYESIPPKNDLQPPEE